MASPGRQLERSEQRRRKRERIIVIAALILVAVITYIEPQVVDLSEELPMGSAFLVFALININALLLLLVIFLVFRNLVKLLLERRKGVLGSKLRTKLVIAFVLFSLAPTILLFFAAFQFVGTSMDYWFSAKVERSLFQALEISEGHTRQVEAGAAHFAKLISNELTRRKLGLNHPHELLAKLVESRRARYDLAAVRVLSPKLKDLAFATQSGTHKSHLQGLPLDLVSKAMNSKKPLTHLQPAPTGDFVAAVHPMIDNQGGVSPQVAGAVVVVHFLLKGAVAKDQDIRQGLEEYRELEILKNPIRTNLYITLIIVTLLIVLAATWFGFHLAKTITVPIKELAQGTQRVAGGDYNFAIQIEGSDEVGTLINSFNRMTADLKTAKARLDEAQFEMARTNRELEQRRRYMEVVLANVAAGVVAVDAGGRITTFNPSAERVLKTTADAVLGRNWRQVVPPSQQEALQDFIQEMGPRGQATVDRQLRLSISGETLNLMVHLGMLHDESQENLGMVVVFEDLSELEKAQRMAAWREVARRIAHEVKNPLTPIKLSAQRLMRRYQDSLAKDQVFAECTQTIVRQVEELRRLVNEFSTFARLPTAHLAPGDLVSIAEDAVGLFRTGHPQVSFELEQENAIPIFDLDREQISRVLINLLDNAMAAVYEGEPPHQVVVRLMHDDILKIVRLEVEDTGPGVPEEGKLHLFEPYFSTKKGGTGLGLAIVSTIVADHNGYIRVQDNQPHGTRMIIELPARMAGDGAREAV